MTDNRHKNQVLLLCRFLKQVRKSRGLSQEKVFSQTGIDVSNYENGRSEPGLNTVLSLCDYYEIPCQEIIKLAKDVELGLISIDEFLGMAE